jgi:hypothetical protein
MSYCWNGDEIREGLGRVWISPFTFQQLYDQTFKPPAAYQMDSALAVTQTYLVVSGLIFTDDTTILDPAWVLTSTITLASPPTGGTYCMEAQNSSGVALSTHCFDLEFKQHDTGEATSVDSFGLTMPYPVGVARIVLKKSVAELVARIVSTNAPNISITSPTAGATWSADGSYAISWNASDLDGGALSYSVSYSQDGNNWVPIGLPTDQTALTIDAAELPGGGNAHIRVLASDGVNTTASVSPAFVVASKKPRASILSPNSNEILPTGAPLLLQGHAQDLEDGAISDGGLRWTSSRDGDLGAGSYVIPTLSQGQHTITLTATDQDGNTSNASVQVFVGSKRYLPAISK